MENNKPKILIIDDEKGLRIGTKRLLDSEGYQTDTAENGTEGISSGLAGDYDVIIIDLKMPDIEGTEVLKEIRKVRPNSVCVIATAFASYDTAIESTRLGAYGYIPKPFTPEELLYQVEKAYSHRKLLLETEKLNREREERLLELAYEKSRLNTVINSLKSGVLVINLTGETAYFNSSVLQLLQISELNIGEYVLDKLPVKISDMVNKYLKSDKYNYKSYSTEIEIKPDNELIIEANCSPIPHPNNSLAGVVVVIRNITENKKIELLKNQFVSMVAHELKTPVAAVLGFMKIILDPEMEISKEKETEFISRSSVRLQDLLTLVNDLLDISRIEMKTKEREITPVNIPETINSVIEMLNVEAEKRNIGIATRFESSDIHFNGDKSEINRIFTNIVGNAIKYNKENGTVTIENGINNNYIYIKISDTGIGLKPAEKEKLFQEFFRAKNEKTRGISGTGLGLSIVKRLVDSYAGKIEVESEYNLGTAFTIFLPINK